MPSRFEIDDELWAEVEPLIPVRLRCRRHPGRRALPDRPGREWHPSRSCTRGSPGGPAAGVRLRLGGDLLAAAARRQRAGAPGLTRTSACLCASTPPGRSMVAGRHRRLPCARPFGGLLTGPSPVDRARPGLSTTCWSMPRASLGDHTHRRQPQRRHPAVCCCRTPCTPAPSEEVWPTPPQAGSPAGRPRLRPRQVSPAPAQAPHQAADRPPGRRARLRSGLPASGGSWSAASPTCTTSVACASATSVVPNNHTAFLTLACAILCWRRLKSL